VIMGPGFGDAIGALVARAFFIAIVVALAVGFGAGYGCKGCNYRLRAPIERRP